ncbi:MAG: DUF2178 domain-containing protein [Actinobacteria bacterium]|nr:DUF2178 domain-containing protein [Actinomycetota bacterium]
MNRNQKRSLYSLLIWLVVALVFVPLFFINGGPSTWGVDKTRFIVSTSFLAAGYISFFIMLIATRRKKTDDIERDERDILISRKASEISLIIVMGYIFFACITLYTLYENTNSVPRGWMWFLGYTCIFTGYISNSAINLILYKSKAGIQ